MAKKQTELPGTRSDDEAPEQKPIKALDEACASLEKARGKATSAGQGVAAAQLAVDKLLRENGITEYVYETSTGVEKKAFISESVKTAKIKKATKRDDDGADE